MLKKPAPIYVADRFPALLDALLELLSGLSGADWQRPVHAGEWTVKDLAQHLVGDELNILSGKRDRFSEPHAPLDSWEELIAFINHRNDIWVQATRRLSPRLICDLLRWAGDQANAYFLTLDLDAPGGPVDWAGSGPAPVWLDVAREFTERWHHQQHIRDAVGKPGVTEPYFLAPVLAAFVRALPRAFRSVDAPEGTAVALSITGESGGVWSAVREGDRWQLYTGKPDEPQAEAELPEETAWRLFTRGLSPHQARPHARLTGDLKLAEKVLETVAILA